MRATGTVVKFDGFLTLYQEGEDDAAGDEDGRRLPEMSAGEALAKRKIDAGQHFTEPPPRYSEAALVKRMEELGIGRPSTYAAILQVLRDRGYVRVEKRRLLPEDKGRVLTAFLESFFARYVEYDFTADLEEQLDRISNNELAWRDLLRDFWRDFMIAIGDIKELRVAQVIDALDEMLSPHLFPQRPDGTDPRQCPNCETGRLSLKLGKFGGFIGRFGPYVQHAKTYANLEAGDDVLTIGLNRAVALIADKKAKGPSGRRFGADPGRALGEHPDKGGPIVAKNGRYGPYVSHDGVNATLPSDMTPESITLEQATSLVDARAASVGGRKKTSTKSRGKGQQTQPAHNGKIGRAS